MRFQPLHVGDLVDALDGDQGRIHVRYQQPEIGKAARAVDIVGIHAQALGARQHQLAAGGIDTVETHHVGRNAAAVAGAGQGGQFGDAGLVEGRGL
ncbi:hypothetical protein D3C72_2090490 [compost metagenome]